MAAISFLLLICFATFAIGDVSPTNPPGISKALLLTTKSAKDLVADSYTIVAYIESCPGGLDIYDSCLTQNNYNFYPTTEEEICRSAKIELTCIDRTLATTSCAGRETAVQAAARTRPAIEAACGGVTSIVAKLLTVILFAFVATYLM